MKTVIILERIGGNNYGMSTSFADCRTVAICEAMKSTGINLLQGIPKHRDWVARIVGFDAKYKYEREFVNGKADYSKSNSVGTRGVFVTYVLESDNIYEINAPVTWQRTARYFIYVDKYGNKNEIKKEDVDRCLRSRLE